jgi:hypothetical protein
VPKKKEVRMSKDKVEFTVESDRPGYVYVYLLATDGNLALLFPNGLDANNRIEANAKLSLPRPAWTMLASGPVGQDRIVAVVSPQKRVDLGLAPSKELPFGLITKDQFPAWAQSQSSTLAGLLGKMACETAASCVEEFGAAQAILKVVP